MPPAQVLAALKAEVFGTWPLHKPSGGSASTEAAAAAMQWRNLQSVNSNMNKLDGILDDFRAKAAGADETTLAIFQDLANHVERLKKVDAENIAVIAANARRLVGGAQTSKKRVNSLIAEIEKREETVAKWKIAQTDERDAARLETLAQTSQGDVHEQVKALSESTKAQRAEIDKVFDKLDTECRDIAAATMS